MSLHIVMSGILFFYSVEAPSAGTECNNDYLLVFDDTNSQSKPQKYCSTFTGVRLIEMGASKTFQFHSNDEISDIGYRYVPSLLSTHITLLFYLFQQ